MEEHNRKLACHYAILVSLLFDGFKKVHFFDHFILKNGSEHLGEVLIGYKKVIKLEELWRDGAYCSDHVPYLVKQFYNIKVN